MKHQVSQNYPCWHCGQEPAHNEPSAINMHGTCTGCQGAHNKGMTDLSAGELYRLILAAVREGSTDAK